MEAGKEGGKLYIYRCTVTTRMTPALKLAEKRAILMFHSLIVRNKVTRQCPQTTTFEEKEKPKQIRTEVPLLTSQTPYRWAKPAHIGGSAVPQRLSALVTCSAWLFRRSSIGYGTEGVLRTPSIAFRHLGKMS